MTELISQCLSLDYLCAGTSHTHPPRICASPPQHRLCRHGQPEQAREGWRERDDQKSSHFEYLEARDYAEGSLTRSTDAHDAAYIVAEATAFRDLGSAVVAELNKRDFGTCAARARRTTRAARARLSIRCIAALHHYATRR